MKIAISAESTIDLSKELLNKYNISTVPFTILLGEEVALDGEINTSELFDFVKEHKVLPKTSAVNEYQFKEHFEKLLKNNDAVIHFSLSKEASCAYDNAMKASEDMENVYVINSNNFSTGIALLAIYACELRDKGLEINEIIEKVKARRDAVRTTFVVEKLDYLKKSGRCSFLQLLGANILQIRPQVIVKNGKATHGKRFRGKFINCVKNYCDETLKEFNTPDLHMAFVSYTSATQEMIDIAVNALKEKGFENIYITNAGCTISSHCGENCIGILYMNDGNKEI